MWSSVSAWFGKNASLPGPVLRVAPVWIIGKGFSDSTGQSTAHTEYSSRLDKVTPWKTCAKSFLADMVPHGSPNDSTRVKRGDDSMFRKPWTVRWVDDFHVPDAPASITRPVL